MRLPGWWTVPVRTELYENDLPPFRSQSELYRFYTEQANRTVNTEGACWKVNSILLRSIWDSNAVRLLIKGIRPGETVDEMTKCVLLRIPLRLGEDAFGNGRISQEKQKRLMRTIKSFRLLMKVFDVVSYRACATSAMRDASNGGRIADRVYAKTGIRIEIIDGVGRGADRCTTAISATCSKAKGVTFMSMWGAASTEVSLIHDGELHSSRCY